MVVHTLVPLSAIILSFLHPSTLPAQQSGPDQQAAAILDAGRKSLAQGDSNGASARFNEVIQKFGTTKSAASARFGLAQLAMLAPEPDWPKVLDQLRQAAANPDGPDYAAACSSTGNVLRILALRDTNPDEAQKRLAEAAKQFEQAQAAYVSQKQEEWSDRALCDRADIELRMGRAKEARALVEPLAGRASGSQRSLALYYHGLSCFALQDYAAAGKSLAKLAPFADPVSGLHARYLFGRVLHLSGENAEAFVQYDGVLADYEKSKLAAAEQIKQPDRFRTQPFELARLRTLAQGAVPEYVGGSLFHSAGISYAAGRFADAAVKYQSFVKLFPRDPNADDAALRGGLALVQLKQYDEAVKLLTPLPERTPRLADQAQFWLAKAHLGIAEQSDPAKPAERDAKWKFAIETMKLAVSQTGKAKDPDALARLPGYQLELADTLLGLGQYPAASVIYADLWNAKALPARGEELLQRYADASGLAGDRNTSTALIAEFRKSYPKSTLMPAIALRDAENSFAEAAAAPAPELWRNAAAKYKQVVDQYPEFERANIARLGLGSCHIQLNDLESAVSALESIPGPDRTGDAAMSAYLLADCLIRLAPTKADDALQENQIREKLDAASANLENFISGNPKSPLVPMALMKYALCQRRLGINLTDGNERNQSLNRAREAYQRIVKDYPQDPNAGPARLEMARTRSLQGDRGGAIADYRAIINADAQARKNPDAVLAAVSLAVMLREQNQPQEADKVLADFRPKYEEMLAKDARRFDLMLKYHHGLALMGMNKPGQARELLDDVAEHSPDARLKLEAALRAGQSRIVEMRKLLQDANNASNGARNDVRKRIAADRLLQQAATALQNTAEQLSQRANAGKESAPNSEVRARMYYDAAWAHRDVAAEEQAIQRDQARRDLQRSLMQEAGKFIPPGSPEPQIQVAEVHPAKLPPTPNEAAAIAALKNLIAEFPDLALSVDARLDLAELLAYRGDHAEAVKFCKAALDVEPADKPASPDVLERVRMRLGASAYQMKDYKTAATQFDILAGNPKSQYYIQSLYRAGESHFAAENFAKAAERLAPFRDKAELQNHGGISDRAILCRAKALIHAKDSAGARNNLEFMIQRFNQNSPHTPEARVLLGRMLETEGKHEDAIRLYEAVMQQTRSEFAAQAAIQIAECRMAQRKFADAAVAYLVVPNTYDYPNLFHLCYFSAVKAYIADQKLEDAELLLKRIIQQFPNHPEAQEQAKAMLKDLKKK